MKSQHGQKPPGKVVLGFSGGLDTTYCVIWLKERGYDPICVTVDVGQGADTEVARKRAAELGVKTLKVVDARQDFADYFLVPALKANVLYQGVYPLATALSRPLIAKVMVDAAQEFGTTTFAHGCTGKGNDQVRFELALRTLVPGAEIIDPIRAGNLSRDEEISFLEGRGIKTGITGDKPFSVDQNLWGRSICAGILEDAAVAPPEEVFDWTRPIEKTPDQAEEIEIEFQSGVPVALNGSRERVLSIILSLNEIGGRHGIGRIDHIEDRLVGIKTRELYEAPAAMLLIKAHQVLESMTLSRAALSFKKTVEREYADLMYLGDWFSQHHMDLVSYLQNNQRYVSGVVRLRLHKGNTVVVGRSAPSSLYQRNLATYSADSIFDQTSAEGYLKILGLEKSIAAKAQLFRFIDQKQLLNIGLDPQRDIPAPRG